jgi:hypothetical protein
MDIDGRNQKQLTFGAEQKDSGQYAALSPDGRELFFIGRGAGPAAIWKVSISSQYVRSGVFPTYSLDPIFSRMKCATSAREIFLAVIPVRSV